MNSTSSKSAKRLIDYIVLCGVKKALLVDYVLSLKESEISNGLSKESLKTNGLIPEIISIYPEGKDHFPLSPHFIDVFFFN